MPAGRPKIQLSDLPEGWEEIIFNMACQGASQIEIRAALAITSRNKGMSKDLYKRLLKEEESFADAIAEFHLFTQAWWEREGRINLYTKDFNYTGWYMNMKNRFGWKDKSDVNHSTDSSDPFFLKAEARLKKLENKED